MTISLASYVVLINQLHCGAHLSETQGLTTYTRGYCNIIMIIYLSIISTLGSIN